MLILKRSLIQKTSGLVAFALAAFVLNACTPPDSERAPDNSTGYVLTVPKIDADAVASRGELVCELSGGCPEGLAMISSRFDKRNETRFKQCSGFLIAADLVATNTHCLPSELQTDLPQTCKGIIKVYFAASKRGQPEAIDCESVVAASSIDENPGSPLFNKRPDFAILRLAHSSSRRPFELSRQGLPDRFTLNVLTVDPDLGARKILGRARARRCVTNQFTITTPQFTNDFASVASATCVINPGNSGSPALDTYGRVRAIVQGTKPSSLSMRDQFEGVDLPPTFSDIGLFSNLACADTRGYLALGPLADQCSQPLLSQNDLMIEVLRATAPDLRGAFSNWLPHSPKLFGFEQRSILDRGRTLGYPYLKCIRPPDQWTSAAGAAALDVDSLQVSGSQVTLQYKTPYWGNRVLLDSDYRIDTHVAKKVEHQTIVTFNLASLRTNGYARTRKTEIEEDGSSTTTGDFDLIACRSSNAFK